MPQPFESHDEALIELLDRLRSDGRVRMTLPEGGRLHLDRRLPFLCVYRQRTDPAYADGLERCLAAEASVLIAPAGEARRPQLTKLLEVLITELKQQFGGFLLIELWDSPPDRHPWELHEESGEALPPGPEFRISTAGPLILDDSVSVLERALKRTRVGRSFSVVETTAGPCHPPRQKPLLSDTKLKRLGCALLGMEVRPVFRHPETGKLFPQVLRQLRRGLSRALRRTCFDFANEHTEVRPRHYYSLGRKVVGKAVWEVDHQLAEISGSFDFLLHVTPLNAEAAWREFRRSRFEKTPVFYYAPLPFEPAEIKRRLFDVRIERINDPTLAELFYENQNELDRRLTLLTDRGTHRFALGSQQVYGDVELPLLTLAQQILEAIPPHSRERRGAKLTSSQFAQQARQEIKYYQRRWDGFKAEVSIRETMYSGLMVSRDTLLLGKSLSIPAARVTPLLQHEVGTHLVTFFNALAQPMRQLASGLAGYDGLQEGLAVLSEYLVDGLSRPRLRLLAARVIAVHMLIDGASFVDTFRQLYHQLQFPRRQAYTIAMRVYRGGGLTKDAVYLRGLVQILDFLKKGEDLQPLLVGKIAADHIPLVRELLFREVLLPPPLRPRYLEVPGAQERIDFLRSGRTVLDLIEKS